MSDERNPSIYISTGQQGVGKSFRTTIEMDEYIKVHGNRCGIIFDVNNEYRQYKTLAVDISLTRPVKGSKKELPDEKAIMKQVVAFWLRVSKGKMSPQIRRIVPMKRNREQFNTAEKILCCSLLLKHAKNCLILLEDLNTYMGRTSGHDVMGNILNKRHKNQDIVIHTQTLDKLDPFLFSQAEIVRMHHQPSSVKRIAHKVPNPELFEIAKRIVDNQFDNKSYEHHKRFFVWVFIQDTKIQIPTSLFKGCKETPAQIFREGCISYMKDSWNTTGKKYMDQVDLTSDSKKKPKKTKAMAVEAYVADKMRFLME
jgi:hypothetical protein